MIGSLLQLHSRLLAMLIKIHLAFPVSRIEYIHEQIFSVSLAIVDDEAKMVYRKKNLPFFKRIILELLLIGFVKLFAIN